MATKTDQTASFMVRFTQNIFEENGEQPHKIKHRKSAKAF